MKDVHYMTRTELEIELTEKREQIKELQNEIKSKNKYLEIYSNYLNEVMEEDRNKILKRTCQKKKNIL